MKREASDQKRRGGYYTPVAIARFLASWAIRAADDVVLEPSCGDGVILAAAAQELRKLNSAAVGLAKQLWAYEIDPCAAARAADRMTQVGLGRPALNIHCQDFFAGAGAAPLFDAVVGNPPFVRYQHFPEDQRQRAFERMRAAGLRPNRLTNLWVPFVVCSSLLLKPHGRLAMVIPAELLQVNYAAELRLFLSRYFDRITVLTFRSLTFEDVQQEVVLLLAERGPTPRAGIEVLELGSSSELARHDLRRPGSGGLRSIDHTAEKWTQYYLSQGEIDLLRALREDRRIQKLGDLASTDVGIVTGMNDVFVLSEQQVTDCGLARFTHPLVARGAHLQGVSFTDADWRANRGAGHRVHLLDLAGNGKRVTLTTAAKEYVRRAESLGLHLGYKCRTRRPWYRVPSIYAPDAFLLRQVHAFPKLVSNETAATCTDTLHRVRFSRESGESDRRTVAGAFLNTLTFAFSEVLGRSYGGGVLELEPNEADRLPVPLRGAERLDCRRIDSQIRTSGVDLVLDTTDRVLLVDGLGLTRCQVEALRSIWIKLRDRRTQRRNGA